MATIRQYFETDFSNTIRVHITFRYLEEDIQGVLLYELSAFTSFLSWYIPGTERTSDYYIDFLRRFQYGQTQFQLAEKIILPSIKLFHGDLRIVNKPDFEIEYRLFGDPLWRSTRDIKATTRVFIYSETNFVPTEISTLQEEAKRLGHDLQFRSGAYVDGRTRFEVPLAFVSHDFRDKQDVARPIAIYLQKMLCPVWYDEFSLKVGDNLRESIEKGLKECQKCVLVLSPNFLSNRGWTKKEFDSIFTRELLEESQLVLPVWYQVSKQQVFDYSPSLLNVKGLDWSTEGEEEVCRQLHRAIVG